MPGASQQILPRPGRRGRRQHHEGHLHQELQRRHQGDHPADAVSQQGQCCLGVKVLHCDHDKGSGDYK